MGAVERGCLCARWPLAQLVGTDDYRFHRQHEVRQRRHGADGVGVACAGVRRRGHRCVFARTLSGLSWREVTHEVHRFVALHWARGQRPDGGVVLPDSPLAGEERS